MTYSVLGIDLQTGQRVVIPKPSRLQGTYIIGANGTGKTGLFKHLIIQDSEQELGAVVFDTHGDLIYDVIALVPEKRLKDVILLDIANEATPFGLNLFTCSNPNSAKAVQYVVDQVMHIFEKLYDVSRQTPRMAQYLRNCTHTLVANPGYTMADIPLLLTDEQCRHKLVTNVTDPNVKLFWRRYDALKPSEQQEYSDPLINKLDELLQPLTRNIVGQAKSTVDFRKIMDERKILLVQLDARLESVTSLIGSVIVAQILNAAYSRADLPVTKRKQFNLYADEFQRYSTDDFAILLTEARKFGIATTIGHQTLSQISERNMGAALQAAILVVFRVSGVDAERLAPQFERTPPPPAVDWLDEQAGEKPVKTFVYNVVDYLLNHEHDDHRVVSFTNSYLRPLQLAAQKQVDRRRQWVEEKGGYVDVVYPKNSLGIEYDPDVITDILPVINECLFQAMKDLHAGWHPFPQQLLRVNAHFFGFETIYNVYHEPTLLDTEFKGYLMPMYQRAFSDEWRVRYGFASLAYKTLETSMRIFMQSIPTTNFSDTQASQLWKAKNIDFGTVSTDNAFARGRAVIEHLNERTSAYARAHPHLSQAEYLAAFHSFVHEADLVDFCLPAFLYTALQLAYYPHTFRDPRPQGRFPWKEDDLPEYRNILVEGTAAARETYQNELSAYLAFCSSLRLTQLGLSQHQIETFASGKYEPDSRKHPIITQRTYPEMVSKIANDLANLPNFTARVKATTHKGTVEHTITTLAPGYSVGRIEGEERKQRIQAQNLRDGYLRERQAVEEEIQQRQERCLQPPQPPEDEPPPISRRPPR